MSTLNFTLYIERGQTIPVSIDPETRIWQFIEQSCAEYHLPVADEQQRPIGYILYNQSQGRVLSREQSLKQTGCRSGEVLYMGLRDDPWWERPEEPEEEVVPPVQRKRLGAAQIGFAIGALVLVLGLAFPFLPGNGSSNGIPTPTSPPSAVAIATPTLAEVPTGEPTVGGTLATPTLLVDTPTPSTSPTPTIQPALRAITVTGVIAGYRTINANYFFSGSGIFGAYLWEDSELTSQVKTPKGFVLLSNGDQVEILSEGVADLYQIRVVTNQLDKNDPAVVGAEGWIARWPIDNVNVPPTPTLTPRPAATPTPTSRRFAPQVVRSYPSSPNSGQRASCVQGRVVDRNGAGVASASLYANNGPSNTPPVIANNNGEFRFCGLGYSQWTLVLNFVPKVGAPDQNALVNQFTQTFFVDGSSSQVAIINFVEVK